MTRFVLVRSIASVAMAMAATAYAEESRMATSPAPPKDDKGAETRPAAKPAMRTYHVALLRRGPKWTAERTPEAVAAGDGHMAHIQEMASAGKLLVAGPFLHGDDAPKDALAGIYVFDVATLEEAVALTQADPAVKAGRFTVEVLPWLGPVGLTYEGAKL